MKVIHYIGINSAIRSAGILSAFLFSVIFSLTFLPISFHQNTTEATGSSDPSITMTFTNSTASVDLAINSTNGTFAESTDATSAKFSVSTSSAAGYTLSISADDDTGNLVNGNESLTSISSAISSSTFDNASYNGKWGYKPSKLNSVVNTNFIQSPTTEATTLDVTDTANNEANNYSIALGARADFSQSTGEYTKSLVVEAVSNFTPVVCDNTKLCVQYDGNGLTYEYGELVNNVNYNSTSSTTTASIHTPNIDDAGNKLRELSKSDFTSADDIIKTLTIPGASSIDFTISYSVAVGDSTLFIYRGIFDYGDYDTNNIILTCGDKTASDGNFAPTPEMQTASCTVEGDAISVIFEPYNVNTSGYGYYATGTSITYERTVASGEYATPTVINSQRFNGWSSTQTTSGAGLPSEVEYTNESDVMSNIPGSEGEAKTLYAVWQQGYDITFNIDSNVSSIAVLDSNSSTVGTITTNGQSLTLYQGSTYTFSPTYATGYVTDTITKTTGSGTLNNNEFTVGAGIATINVTSRENPCDDSKLCVQYDGNGLLYNNSETTNVVNYNSTTTQQAMTKYSHTPNIADDGTYSGSTYTSNMDVTDTVTIDGASTLNVTIYYDTESTSYDWVSVYQSPFDISNTNDATVSDTTGNLSGKLGGRNTDRTTSYTTWYTQSYTVTGDTVKFHFRSDSSDNYYGYYAIITGTGTVINRTVASGEYATPASSDAIFHGWSSTQTTAGTGLPSQVEYTNESEVMSKMPGNNGDTKTLYAVWQQGYPITFTKDSNVSSIAVLDSNGDTVGTITSSGQSISLYEADTYTIKPTHTTGYRTDAITKTSGAGTLNGKEFTIGAGAATISVTSKPLEPMQDWTGCSSLAIGGTEQVYDTRDNEVYLVGKLKDGKCWMLDNLRLDLGNSTVLANITDSNTNASATALNYLKNGGGTTSDKYPTARINNVAWTSSSQNYYSIPMTASTYKDTVADTKYGLGSGKIGVYYNYCAASAGTYCWGNGTSTSGTPADDPNTSSLYDIDGDICPKGWRMPTGRSDGEFKNLSKAITGSTSNSIYYSDASSFQSALSTLISSSFYNGRTTSNIDGYLWSSTWADGYNAMSNISVKSSSVSLSSSGDRSAGIPLRCLLK